MAPCGVGLAYTLTRSPCRRTTAHPVLWTGRSKDWHTCSTATSALSRQPPADPLTRCSSLLILASRGLRGAYRGALSGRSQEGLGPMYEPKAAKKLTIEDIGRLAGVSRATVSRVLNQRPDVDREPRLRVLQIIKEQDY